MRQLTFDVRDWVGDGGDGPAERVTLGTLSIAVGASSTIATKVEDTIARTVRDHVTVPVYPLAQWLLLNWWRLRCEPIPIRDCGTTSWLRAHSMASIGGGVAWPALEFAGEGAFVRAAMPAESSPDAAAIRYLNAIDTEIPTAHFDAAVDALVEAVLHRLSPKSPEGRSLLELRHELAEERADDQLSEQRRWEALGGFDSGDAPKRWFQAVRALSRRTGATAIDEVLAITPYLDDGVSTGRDLIEQVTRSATIVDLSACRATDSESSPSADDEKPWRAGRRLAAEFRDRIGVPQGPLGNDRLGALLGLGIPVATGKHDRDLAGAMRRPAHGSTATVLVPSRHENSQRFYFARLIACAMVSSSDQALLPVTSAFTGLQKLERAFAQELLCPWRDLEPFVDARGVDESSIEDASDYFGVSPWLVTSTLVNNGRLPRERLQLLR